ncbi:MAG: hypothetical protein Ta2A_13730 [Treponemataceae bacterium]|nr:MAG: hypothetical protein Ta2A_13730 [Treponemataceae bacterium]
MGTATTAKLSERAGCRIFCKFSIFTQITALNSDILYVVKKRFLSFLCFVLLSAGASALDVFEFRVSAGGGATLQADFLPLKAEQLEFVVNENYANFGGGIFTFVDLTFAEINVSVLAGSHQVRYTYGSVASGEANAFSLSMDFAVLGKYPVKLNDKVSVTPLLGIGYHLFLFSIKDPPYQLSVPEYEKRSKAMDFSSVGFKVGAGLNYELTDFLFLHTELLYTLRLPGKYADTFSEAAKAQNITHIQTMGHGATINIGVGVRF